MTAVKEAVILASGLGKRLRGATGGVPKCFHVIEGEPLIAYPIKAIKAAGVSRFDIVVSRACGKSCSDASVEVVEKLTCGSAGVCVAFNDKVEWGNAYSLMVARECVEGDRFIVSVCDSLYPPDAVLTLLERAPPEADIVVAGSRCFDYVEVDEATKIKLGEDGAVAEIGKGVRDFDLIDIGLFVMKSTVFSLIDKMPWGEREFSLFDLLMKGIEVGLDVRAVDLGYIPWTEIDTVDDLNELLRGKRSEVLKAVRG